MSEAATIAIATEKKQEKEKSVHARFTEARKLVQAGETGLAAREKVGISHHDYYRLLKAMRQVAQNARDKKAASGTKSKKVEQVKAKRKYTRRIKETVLPAPMHVFKDIRQQAERPATITPVAAQNSQPMIVLIGDVDSVATILAKFRGNI